MFLSLREKNIVPKLYSFLIISAMVQYIPYAYMSISMMMHVRRGYVVGSFELGSFGYFIYIKDILSVIVFIALFQKNTLIRKPAVFFSSICVVGGVVNFLSGNFSEVYLVAGIRSFLLFFDTVLYVDFLAKNQLLVQDLSSKVKLFLVLLFIEFVVVLAQIMVTDSLGMFGSGGLRYAGTFGYDALLGYFGVASAFVLLVSFEVLGCRYQFWKLIALSGMAMFICFASGSRAAIFLSYVVLVFMFVLYFYRKMGIHRKKLFTGVTSVLIFTALPFYGFVVDYISRGDLDVSGSTRMEILKNLLYTSSMFEMFFGHGAGYGTNMAVSLGEMVGLDSMISDGTITAVFAQFGTVGVVIFLVFFSVFFLNFYVICNKYRATWATSVIVFVGISFVVNLFEQSALMLMFAYCSYVVYKMGLLKSDS